LSSQGSHELQHILPRGIWHRFDFADSHPVWLLRVVIVVSSFFAKDLTLFFYTFHMLVVCFMVSGFTNFIFTRGIHHIIGSSTSACWGV